MTIDKLQEWLIKTKCKGAVTLKVEMDCFFGTVKLCSKDASGTVIQHIMLQS